MLRNIFRFSGKFLSSPVKANCFKCGTISTVLHSQQHTSSNQTVYCAKFPVALLALSLPFFKKDDTEDPDPIVTAFKNGVLAAQKDDYQLSQKFFHQGLGVAAKQHKEKQIDDRKMLLIQINAYGRMGDIAMKFRDFNAAEKLYKSTMEKCLQAGKSQDDPALIELSIKLASLYAMQSRDEEAQVGFSACLKATEALMESEGGLLESDTNLLALHGLTCQSYARFKMKLKKHGEAVKLYKKSLEVAEEVYGAIHPQVLVVLNDLASAHIAGRNYELGIECYQLAIERAKTQDESDESLTTQVAFNYNLGEAYILKEEFEKAQQCCDQCHTIASRLGKPQLLQAAKQCATDVRDVRAKLEKKETVLQSKNMK